MFQNYALTKRKVLLYLQKDEHTRDEDEKLVCAYWMDELLEGNQKASHMTAVEFLNFYRSGMLTPAEVITKAKKELQDRHRNLRGQLWLKRRLTYA